jgi:hypothetical protein
MKKILLSAIVAILVVSTGGLVASAEKGGNDGNENREEKSNTGMGHKSVGSSLEVHINDNGKVLVRGAEITAISGTTITAKNMFGSYAMIWTVRTDTDTKFVRKHGGASVVSELSVGDFMSFSGAFDTTATTPTVNASLIKDWSIQKLDQVLTGEVKSVNTGALSFVLNTEKKGDVSVLTNTSTTFTNGTTTGNLANVVVGVKAKVRGVWNSTTNILTATSVKVLVEDND